MVAALSQIEQAQLLQTIEMFEVITQAQPTDHQSLEILKEAYSKMNRQQDVVNTSKRIAQAYAQEGQLSSAILEYESILQLSPNDPDVIQALTQIESRATPYAPQAPAEAEPAEKPRRVTQQVAAPSRFNAENLPHPSEIEDGRAAMQKLFVDTKLIAPEDFTTYWYTPNLAETPAQIVEPFLQVLADKGVIPLDKSLPVLAEKSQMPYMPVDRYDVDTEVARLFPRDICLRWCVLPFDRMSKSIMVATANPFNKYAMRELEHATKNRLLWYLCSPPDLLRALKKAFR